MFKTDCCRFFLVSSSSVYKVAVHVFPFLLGIIVDYENCLNVLKLHLVTLTSLLISSICFTKEGKIRVFIVKGPFKNDVTQV